MELILNIYDNNKIIRTYTADKITLTTGVVEDILQNVNIDNLVNVKDDNVLGTEILKIVIKSYDKFKVFIKQIFEGMTDEEYRMTSVTEVAICIIQVVNYAISELFKIGDNSKN